MERKITNKEDPIEIGTINDILTKNAPEELAAVANLCGVTVSSPDEFLKLAITPRNITPPSFDQKARFLSQRFGLSDEDAGQWLARGVITPSARQILADNVMMNYANTPTEIPIEERPIGTQTGIEPIKMTQQPNFPVTGRTGQAELRAATPDEQKEFARQEAEEEQIGYKEYQQYGTFWDDFKNVISKTAYLLPFGGAIPEDVAKQAASIPVGLLKGYSDMLLYPEIPEDRLMALVDIGTIVLPTKGTGAAQKLTAQEAKLYGLNLRSYLTELRKFYPEKTIQQLQDFAVNTSGKIPALVEKAQQTIAKPMIVGKATPQKLIQGGAEMESKAFKEAKKLIDNFREGDDINIVADKIKKLLPDLTEDETIAVREMLKPTTPTDYGKSEAFLEELKLAQTEKMVGKGTRVGKLTQKGTVVPEAEAAGTRPSKSVSEMTPEERIKYAFKESERSLAEQQAQEARFIPEPVKPPATTPEIGTLRQAETKKTPKPSITEQGARQKPPQKPPAPPVTPEELATKYPEPPHINIVERLAHLTKVEPTRVVLGRDPHGDEIYRIVRTGLEEQNRVFNEIALNKPELKRIGKLVDVEEMIRLQESGITQDPAAIAKLLPNEKRYVELLEDNAQRVLELSKKLGKDVENWRFVNRYFPRMWRGDQVIREVDDAGRVIKTWDITNRAEAIMKLDELIKENPDKTFKMRPRYEAWSKETPAGLSREQYFRLLKKLADLTESTVADVMDEIAGQGIIRIVPKKTKIGSFEFRKGALDTYIKDPVKVYDALFQKLTKRLYLDPEIGRATKLATNIKDPALRQYAEKYIEFVGQTGKYVPPAINPKIVGGITKVQSALKMWGRVGPAVANYFQKFYALGIARVDDVIGAFKLRYSPEGKDIIRRLGIESQQGIYEGEGLLQRGSRLLQPTMFQFSEASNREWTTMLGYVIGKRRPLAEVNAFRKTFGLKKFDNIDELAEAYARNYNYGHNFDYSKAGTMELKRSGLGKVALQFKDYPANHIANLVSVAQGKPISGLKYFYPTGLTTREKAQQVVVYFANMFSQGGLRAVGFGLEKTLPVGVLTYLAVEAPWVLYGIPSVFGFDISRSTTTELANLIPDTTWELLGATAGDIGNIKDAAKYYYKGDTDKANERLARISPAVLRMYRAIKSLAGDNIKYWGKSIKLTPIEAIEYGIGLTPTRLSQIETLGKLPSSPYKQPTATDILAVMKEFKSGQYLTAGQLRKQYLRNLRDNGQLDKEIWEEVKRQMPQEWLKK